MNLICSLHAGRKLVYYFLVSEVSSTINLVKTNYWPLVKSRQTFLLTLTGLTGFLCQPIFPINWLHCLGLTGSLLLTISGSTVLNMLIDRDIDRKMHRTSWRPLATNQVGTRTALTMGLTLIMVGLFWSILLSLLYFTIVLAGVVINVLVYSMWLKRLTAWSILFGGIAGGMPILAGRVLTIGQIDTLGIILALIIVFWIPGHNLTLDMVYEEDYRNAGIPTAVNVYGTLISYLSITISTILVATLVFITFSLLNLAGIIFAIILVGSVGMVIFSMVAWFTRKKSTNQALYKYMSLYLLVLMLTLALAGIF